MATYVNNLRLKEIATGDESGTWGTSTNTNLELIGEALGIGTEAITTNANTHTTTVADGSSDAGRAIYLKYTGALDSDCTITIGPNTMKRVHIIENATTDSGSSGPYNIIISQGSGSNVTIANGKVAVVQLDGAGSGAAVLDAFTDLQVTDSLSVNGTTLTIGDATAEDTKLVFDGNAQDFYIGLDDSADDLVIGLGSTVGTTPIISLTEAGAVNLKNVGTGDDNPMSLTLQTSETDIAADDVLGKISFQAPDEGTGTDAILVAAAIQAISEGDFSASSNATSLAFMTGASEAATTKMTVTSAGNVGIGETTVDSKLEIKQGSANWYEGIRINRSSNTTQFGTFSNNSGATFIGAADTAGGSNNAILFGNSTDGTTFTERMRIGSSGGIAIGQSSLTGGNTLVDIHGSGSGVGANIAFANDHNTNLFFVGIEGNTTGDAMIYQTKDADINFYTNNTFRAKIDNSGNLGLGTTSPSAALDILGTTSDQLRLRTAGSEEYKIGRNASTGLLDFSGTQSGFTGYTFGGVDGERMRIGTGGAVSIGTTTSTAPFNVQADGAARGIRIIGRDNGTSDEAAITFADNSNNTTVDLITVGNALTIFQGGSETARLNSAGNLLIGTSTDVGVAGGGIRLTYPTSESDGDVYFAANGGGSNATPFVLKVVSQNLYDSGTTAMHVGRHSGNQRSISAGGTINASGADYAEYMKKADSCGTIAKGDVCGVDSTGKLTDVFNNSISFVIKSTDPSYVGGDTWGSVDLNLSDEQAETERQKHDRIAFSGQVPVNITGSFNVGDYVYPQANGTAIQCVAKSNPTFEEYQLCVGKIWATQSDGRPLVAVKIG